MMLSIRMLFVLTVSSLFLYADAKKMLEMSEKLDKLDSQEVNLFLEKADECTYRRDFYCAASYHEKAKNLATTASLKAKLQASISQLDNEKERVYRERKALEQEEEERREREAIEQQRLAQQEEDAYYEAQRNANMSNFMMQKMNETNPFNQQFNRQVPRSNNYIPPQPQYRSNEYKPQTQTTQTTQKQYTSNTSQTTQNTQNQSYTNQTTPPPQTTQQPVAQNQKSFTPIIKNDVSSTYGLTYEQSQTWCKRKADEMRSWNWSPNQLISIGECSCSLGKNSVANDSNMLRKEYSCELKYVWQQNSAGGAR